MTLKVVLELLLDVPKVLLEVLEVVLSVHVTKTPFTPIALYKKPQGTGEGTLIFLGLGHILAPFWVHLGVV